MEIKGTIIELLPEQSGETAKGPWRKQECIMETEVQYQKKVCFMVWGDKIEEFGIKQGDSLVVSIDLESREFNGRWYTDVKAWKVTRSGAAPADIPFSTPEAYNKTPPESPTILDDEIPF